MFIICLNNVRFSLSIFAFIHHHVAYSFFVHFDPHVMISSNYLKGSSRVGSLGYSKDVFIISHILSNMLEIKVYSIIVSKVFDVTIIVNFLFAIVIYMFKKYKWVVAIEKFELGIFGGEGEIMQFDYSSSKNVPRHKRFQRLNSNIKIG